MDKPKVVMMGLGYIGLPTAALIASRKINVLGIDIEESVVNTINQGKIHIVEPDLDALVKNVVETGFLKASTTPEEGDVFMIAVPTPFKGDHEPDISYVESATKMIIPYLKRGDLYIIESTSPVKTTEKMADLIYSSRPDLKGGINIAYCPERVLPGQIIYELENNDRVIGGIDEVSAEKAADFYFHFVKGELHKTNSRTAEMCKLVENSYRDVNIAFANELSIICDKIDIDVNELITYANKHPRVNILNPGPGVGGHCIAIDPWFIVADFKSDAKIIKAARDINLYKAEWVIEKIKKKTAKFNKNELIIACLGISYKPDIDDLRESPSLEITEELIKEGYNVLVVEPNIEKHDKFNLFHYEEAVKKADVIVILVPHRQFKKIKFDRDKVILDFCGVIK
jgi:UDP-N-acetyl-D-mannosaminuronic acid dehydrogenase